MDIDDLIKHLINQDLKKTVYSVMDPGSMSMLSWATPQGIQFLTPHVARIGTIGDGNCLLHSILFTTSPAYRACSQKDRGALAVAFRNFLKSKEDDLRTQADLLYPDIGGAEMFNDSFITLHDTADQPEELDIEMGPFIARHFDMNFLAVKLESPGTLIAACMTHKGYDPTKKTIVVNYYGGGLDFGSAAAGQAFAAGGHYEAIVNAVTMPTKLSAPAPKKKAKTEKATVAKKTTSSGTRKRTKGFPVILDDLATHYLFTHEHLVATGIMALFDPTCPDLLAAPPPPLRSSSKSSKKKSSSSLLSTSLPSSVSSETKKKLALE
jgi:hypothetical protein